MSVMESVEIQSILPHRYPFLLVDRIRELDPDRRIVGIKNVTINEPFFQGHFPGHPIMPGVLILEAMAQASGILVFRTRNAKPDTNTVYYYAGIDKARFKRPIVPGDQLEIEATILAHKRGIWKFACVSRVGGAVNAEAEILCTERAEERA